MPSSIDSEILPFPFWLHIAVSGCTSMLHSIEDISFEFVVFDNFAFAARIIIIMLIVELFGHIGQHD